MEMIRHMPCGMSPYESCGFDRRPLYPLAGQAVELGCAVPPGMAPRLELRRAGGTVRQAGRPDGEGLFRFAAGPFDAGEAVSYRFCAPDGTATEWFDFTVRARRTVNACRLRLDGNRAAVTAAENGAGDAPGWIFQPEAGGFVCRSAHKGESAGQTVARAEIPGADGCRLELESSPFRVWLKGPDGRPLLSLRGLSLLSAGGKSAGFVLEMQAAGRGFYGFGEKFDRVNQKGLAPRNVVYEHFTHQGEYTYLPVPWVFTEAGWGIYCDTGCELKYDLTAGGEDSATLRIAGDTAGLPPLHILTGRPANLLAAYQRLTGPCELPPEWAFGPWLSANGWSTQKEALEQIDAMRRENIPATVMVLEAWSDEATFYIFNGARYTPRPGGRFSLGDFTFPADGPWPDPAGLAETLRENGLHLVLWQIPVIKADDGRHSPQLRQDEKEAVEKGYCVKNADGTPYRIPDRWFAGSLVPDFTNPAAVEWWFAKRAYLRDELHVEGFKTDGGEFIYDTSVRFANGQNGEQMRNPYPARYVQAYHRFVREGGREGITFSRAGYAGIQQSPLIWAGDQVSEFSEMRSQLRAGLSAGLSGIPFWGFDLAGFAGELPDTELYLRGVEMAAFSPVMQFHSEPRSGQFGDDRRRDPINDRSPWNMARVNRAPEILEVYRRYARLRMRLLPYIWQEARHCVQAGRPLLCHLIYDFPDDPAVIDREDEYLFGRGLLVAPVLEAGCRSREVYLPAGEWRDFWSPKTWKGPCTVDVPCAVDSIPVFIRAGASLPDGLPEQAR